MIARSAWIGMTEEETMSAISVSPTRREGLIATAAKGAISMGLSKSSEAAEAGAIRPFQFRASDEDLSDLKRRVAATRWPDRETVADQSQGVQLDIAHRIQAHWANHDWCKLESR